MHDSFFFPLRKYLTCDNIEYVTGYSASALKVRSEHKELLPKVNIKKLDQVSFSKH